MARSRTSPIAVALAFLGLGFLPVPWIVRAQEPAAKDDTPLPAPTPTPLPAEESEGPPLAPDTHVRRHPEIALAIDRVTYTDLATTREDLEGRFEIDVIATVPASEPDFPLTDRRGWVVGAEPRERVILADGTKRVSRLPDRTGHRALSVDAIAEWTPVSAGPPWIPPDLASTLTGPRAQHVRLTVNLCRETRQEGDPHNLRRIRNGCHRQPVELFSPCGESVPFRVWFDNGYRGQRAVSPSAEVAFTRSEGQGCSGPALGREFRVAGRGADFLVEPRKTDPVGTLAVPISHNVFPGYRRDGVSRFYFDIQDPATARNRKLLVSTIGARKLPIPYPAASDHVLVAAFRDATTDKAGRTVAVSEEEVLPCGQPRSISVWHEFLNVPRSLTQTAPVLYTRKVGRGCKAGKPAEG